MKTELRIIYDGERMMRAKQSRCQPYTNYATLGVCSEVYAKLEIVGWANMSNAADALPTGDLVSTRWRPAFTRVVSDFNAY